MKKTILPIVLFSLVLGFVLFARGSHDSYSLSHEADNGEKKENTFIIARTDIFGQLQRPGVFFDHGLHTKTNKTDGCRTCHKRDSAGQLSFSRLFVNYQKGKESVRDSFHHQCIGCHKQRLQEHRKSGPLTCGNCHRKESGKIQGEYPHCVFDFYHHDKHNRTLKNDCSLCHHIYDPDEEDEKLRLVYEASTEESCYYCHDLTVKRGPELAKPTKVSEQKGLSMQRVAHHQCVNCHLRYTERKEKAGPVECVKCHTGKYHTVSDLLDIPRPDRGQPKKPLISLDNARMKGVVFDHAFHEKNNGSCRVCHHETLRACKQCHGLIGSSAGNWINLANVYHDFSTDSGCAGCHREKKSNGNCTGCHYRLLDMDLQAKGPKKEVCIVCHSGKMADSVKVQPVPLPELNTLNVPENVTIRILEEKYEPSTFPHRKIIKKLIGISNKSKMAAAFHRNMQTICRGCHHQSIPEAAIKKAAPPYCRNCHGIKFDQQNMNRPRLLAAYHRQCMGCHERMAIKKTGCTDCHKEKKGYLKISG